MLDPYLLDELEPHRAELRRTVGLPVDAVAPQPEEPGVPEHDPSSLGPPQGDPRRPGVPEGSLPGLLVALDDRQAHTVAATSVEPEVERVPGRQHDGSAAVLPREVHDLAIRSRGGDRGAALVRRQRGGSREDVRGQQQAQHRAAQHRVSPFRDGGDGLWTPSAVGKLRGIPGTGRNHPRGAVAGWSAAGIASS